MSAHEGGADRVISVEAALHDEERVVGAFSMAGLDEVEIVSTGGRVEVRAYWPLEAGPAPSVDLRGVPGARSLPDRVVPRAKWASGWPTRSVGPFDIVAVGADRGPEPTATSGRYRLFLEAGRGFGFAEHPSTRLALLALCTLPAPLKRVLDFGCGTGVLGLAALRLGAASAVAYDTDPGARAAATANAARNGLPLTVVSQPPAAPADLVLANITTGVLTEIAGRLTALVAPGGRLILAGLLEGHAAALVPRYRPLALEAEHRDAGWLAVTLRRGDGAHSE